ncbi:ribonuclease P protein subunit p20 [Macrosteles quadrilineatus]|uniref:ribonuclease P protein subunit p20 n=1 Tax=Macrosteles quadrilineatus TaxID=74068 RepID=UPI0023E2A425|nr:ribonuclease P protein subunit p20 [Macrosteles quadrilineatus]
MADDGQKNHSKNKKHFNKNNSFNVRKRGPPHVRRNNDIYVTSKSNFQGQLSQCDKLFQEGEEAIFLHGIGAAIPRTINLALQLNERYPGAYEVNVETSTVTLVDDLEPLDDSADYDTRTRQNSSIKIKISKKKDCPVNQL